MITELTNDIKLAVDFLKENGCTVLKPKNKNHHGPDLNAIKNETAFRIEVKKLRKQKYSYIVDKVEENRKSDDFIIVVYKNEVILFQSMETHLRLCGSSGQRILTAEMAILDQ